MNDNLSPALSAMAGGLALGVLEGEERAAALRHALVNPAFAGSVADWSRRLEPLYSGFASVPAPDLWPKIEAQLDGHSRSPEIRKLRFWQSAALASGTVAASLAAAMIFTPIVVQEPGEMPAQVVIAQLAGADGTLLNAKLDVQNSRLSIRAVTLPDSEQVPELWVIPADGVPRSLGLIEPHGTTQVALPAALSPLLVDGALLAISLEEADGAPHTAPSSTPIATGKITAI
jgi:anti-sigma-K factor RskA